MDDPFLLTPGPVTVDKAVLETVSEPVTVHYGDRWMAIYGEVLADLQAVFQTSGTAMPVTAPGSAVLEMGLSNLAAAGEKVIVVNNGYFGNRLVEFAHSYQMDCVTVDAHPTQPIGAEQVGPAFDANPDAVAIAVVQHDTTTGVINDVQAIAQLARERGALCMVDAVSSLGGMDVPVDAWDVDVCVTVGNKCIGGLPGVGAISISERAWDAIGSKETRGWYLNLQTWRWYMDNWADWHPFPTTVATSTIRALSTALKAILQEGLPATFQRHAAVAKRVREGLRGMGFETPLPEEHSSPVLTAVRRLPDMDVDRFSKWLLDERGLKISGGLGDEFAGEIFRVGHMGQAGYLPIADRFLSAVQDYLSTQA